MDAIRAWSYNHRLRPESYISYILLGTLRGYVTYASFVYKCAL